MSSARKSKRLRDTQQTTNNSQDSFDSTVSAPDPKRLRGRPAAAESKKPATTARSRKTARAPAKQRRNDNGRSEQSMFAEDQQSMFASSALAAVSSRALESVKAELAADNGGQVVNDKVVGGAAASGKSAKSGRQQRPAAKAAAAAAAASSSSSSRRRSAATSASSSGSSKGLRRFSLKVCQKVELKGVTNYAEVADELVEEYKRESAATGTPVTMVDQKNIRRRVYDALNVLRAMNVISKEKKQITWIGLPYTGPEGGGSGDSDGDMDKTAAAGAQPPPAASSSTAIPSSSSSPGPVIASSHHQQARGTGTGSRPETADAVESRIARKQKLYDELVQQQIWYRNLLTRNSSQPELQGPDVKKLSLPFVVINTRRTSTIDCSLAANHSEYFFNFSEPFKVHDDSDILRALHEMKK